MYWVVFSVSGIYLVLLWLSRKEEAAEGTVRLLRPLYKMAVYLYKRIYIRLPGLHASSQVEKDLIRLYPGEAVEYLKTQYYVGKVALCMAVFLAGTLLGAAVELGAGGEAVLGEGGVVERGDYRQGVRKIRLMAEYGKRKMSFWVQVEPRRLSEAEAEELFDDFLDKLPVYILGKNKSLDYVTSDLVLEESYDGYPITVEWESGRPELLGSDGRLYSVGQVQKLLLSVRLNYGGYEREAGIDITLSPPAYTEEERIYMELEELLLQTHEGSAKQEGWPLPAEWQGEDIRWKQVTEENGLLLWAMAAAAAVSVYFLTDRDLHGRQEKRRGRLRREYPEILHKLVLYIGAGMTARGAFQKIAAAYEKKRRGGGGQSPAYEEMLYTCRELYSGVSEGRAYENFGRRAGLQEYIRLSTLLMQNLKRGNAALLERLREEADKAAEERLRGCRKAGEEAGTKLLVPMVLMLAVVMAVIMIPAFTAI